MTRKGLLCLGFAAILTTVAAPAAAPLDPGWTALLQGGDLGQAEASLKQRIEKDSADAGASYALALLQQAQGQREKAVATAVEGLKSAPSSPLACVLQELVTQEATFNLATERLVRDSIPILAAEPGLDPLVRFNLRWAAYQLASRGSDAAARREARKAAGFLPGAYISDPEVERSRVGFYEVAPAERGEIKASRWTYRAPDAIDVRPPSYAAPAEKEFNFLLLVPFKVQEAQSALLYINGSKCFRVDLDDKLLFTKDVFKIQENPTSVRRLSLAAGLHRLVVKVHAGQSGGGLHIALLGGDGNPLKAEYLSEPQPAAEKTAGFQDQGEFLGFFPQSFPKDDPRWPGFHALWEEWLGDVAQARLDMEDAAEGTPKGLAWNLLTARMYLFDAEDLPQKIAQSRAERAVERALGADGGMPLPQYFQALIQGENSDAEEDLVTLRTLCEKHTEDPRWFVTLAQRLQGKGWNDLARKVLTEASSYHPACEAVETAWVSFYQQLPDPAGQEQAIERLARLRNVDPEREELYGSTRRWADLRTLIEAEAARLGDYDRHYEQQVARLDVKTGDYASARKRFETLAQGDPKDADTALQLARCCFLMGDKAAGFSAWDELKKRKPDAFQVDLGRMVLGEPWPFQEKHLTLEQVLQQDKNGEPDQAPSSLILDQMFTRVERDGSSLERYHGILRINDKEGVDREGEQSLAGQVILSVRTIKPDGRILEPEQIPEKDTISLQGLEPGDLVEYEYITLRPPTGVKRDAYVTNQVFVFQDIEKPFHRTQWYLEWPKGIPMQFEERNLPAPGKRGESGGTLWADWDYRAMPRIPREPDTPNKLLYVPLVEAVGGITWKDVGLFLKEGVTGSFQVTPELQRCYRKAVEGAATPQAKLDAIVRYVLKEIDGDGEGGWQDPTQALMTRQGNRVPVACAFLELAGIPHRLLIAEAVPDKVYRQNLPRLGQFRYPVLEADLPGAKPRYYTLNSPYRDPNALGWYLQGATALPVTADQPWTEITIPSSFEPWIRSQEKEVRELSANGDLKLVHSGTLDPEAEESLRATFARMAQDQWKRVIQMSLAKRYGNADLLDYKLEGLDDVWRPLEWAYTLAIHGYASADRGRLTISDPLPALQLGQAFGSLGSRTLPLSTGGPILINQDFTIKLPPGARLDYPLQSQEVKSEFGSYKIAIELKGDALYVQRQAEIPYQVVWPAKYPALVAFLKKIDAAESGQMTVTLSDAGPQDKAQKAAVASQPPA